MLHALKEGLSVITREELAGSKIRPSGSQVSRLVLTMSSGTPASDMQSALKVVLGLTAIG